MSDSADQELTVTLATVTSFQGAVQHADDKLRTIVAVLGMVTAFLGAQLAVFARPTAPGLSDISCLIAVSLFLVCELAAGMHVFRGLSPYTRAPSLPNRFAFPSVAGLNGGLLPCTSVREQCLQAWQLAGMLARLAMQKNRHIRHALTWTGCAYLSSMVSLAAFAVAR